MRLSVRFGSGEFSDSEPGHLAVRECVPERRLRRRIEPHQLLDRRRDQARILSEPPELVQIVVWRPGLTAIRNPSY